MSTTAASSTAPKPAEANAKPAQAGTRAQKDKPEGVDIFSSLLNLLANTQVLPEPNALAGTLPDDHSVNGKEPRDALDNPFIALLGWGLGGAADATLGKANGTTGADGNIGLPGAAWSADRTGAKPNDGKIDIGEMVPVEPSRVEIDAKGAVALPANALRAGAGAGASQLAAMRASDAVSATPHGNSTGASWRHASMASTETVAIQQSLQHTTMVRSTVALNERFGLTPGVPLASTELRDAVAGEGLSLPGSVGTSSRAPDGGTAAPAMLSGDGAAGSEDAGSDTSAFEQADAQADNPFAEANAGEEPAVTHWGTQHLRHASLRVAGETDQAIDIQLSMKGQEVQVEFKTDSAEARASLRENAGEALSDLLNKSGIQLGGVSVGAQGQSGSRSDDGAGRQSGVRAAMQAVNTSAAATTRQAQSSPRADGSQPLDVFA